MAINLRLSELGLSVGTHSIKVKARASGYADSVLSTEITYTVTDFPFTIDGVLYYAEEGMTWSEWVESEYNTGAWRVNNGNIHNGLRAVKDVAPNDVISKNGLYEYSSMDGGGSN